MNMNKEASLSFKEHSNQQSISHVCFEMEQNHKVNTSQRKRNKKLSKVNGNIVTDLMEDIFHIFSSFRDSVCLIIENQKSTEKSSITESTALKLILKYFIFVFTLYGPILIINNSILNIESITSVLFLALSITVNLYVEGLADADEPQFRNVKILFFSALNLKFLVCAIFNTFDPRRNVVSVIRMFHIQIYLCCFIFLFLRKQNMLFFHIMFFLNKLCQIVLIQVFVGEGRNYFLEHCINLSVHILLLSINIHDNPQEAQYISSVLQDKSIVSGSFSSHDFDDSHSVRLIKESTNLKIKPIVVPNAAKEIKLKPQIVNSSFAYKRQNNMISDDISNRNSSESSERVFKGKKLSKSKINNISVMKDMPSSIPIDTSNLLSLKNKGNMLSCTGLLIFQITESKFGLKDSISFTQQDFKYFVHYCNPYLLELVHEMGEKLSCEADNNKEDQIFLSGNLNEHNELSDLQFLRKLELDHTLTDNLITQLKSEVLEKPESYNENLKACKTNKLAIQSSNISSLHDILYQFACSVDKRSTERGSFKLSYKEISQGFASNNLIFKFKDRYFKADFSIENNDFSKLNKSDNKSNTQINNTAYDSTCYLILYDITSFVKVITKLLNKFTEKQNTLSYVAHEFKTPLLSIVNLANNILSSLRLKEDIKDDVENISGISHYTHFLINDFIQIFKEDSHIQICKRKVDLKSILDFCNRIMKTLLKSYWDRKNVIPHLEIDNNLVNYEIVTDEVRLKQVLLNFISNAVKFTYKGKIRIVCAVRNGRASTSSCLQSQSKSTYCGIGGLGSSSISSNVEADTLGTIGAVKAGEIDLNHPFIEISIIDDGLGIKKDTLDKIKKENFTEIKIEHGNNPTGTGLGLRFTNNIIKKLGYKMNINSELNKGTHVSILIQEGVKLKNYSHTSSKNSLKNSTSRLKKVFKTRTQHTFINRKSHQILKRDSRLSSSVLKIMRKESQYSRRKFKSEFDQIISSQGANSAGIIKIKAQSIRKRSMRLADGSNIQCELFTRISPEITNVTYYNSEVIHKKKNYFLEIWSPEVEQSKSQDKSTTKFLLDDNQNQLITLMKVTDSKGSLQNKANQTDEDEGVTERKEIKDYDDDDLESFKKLLNPRRMIECINEFAHSRPEKFVACTDEKDYILIVDDIPIMRANLLKRLQTILKEMKIFDLEVRTGDDGVDIISHVLMHQRENRLKCVISDETMEYINGSKAVALIKSISKPLAIPLLVCYTGYDDEDKKSALISAGFNITISKEISTNELKDLLLLKGII